MKKKAFLLILIMFSSLFVFSQSYKGRSRVFGFVYDEEGNPIEGVTVKLFSLRTQDGFSIVTDSNGKWIASWIKGGGWDVAFDEIDDTAVLYNIGTNFYKNSLFEEALRYYKKAVEIQEDFLDGLYQLAMTYLALGHYQEAINVFGDYLKRDPDSERASQVNRFVEFLKKKIKGSQT